MSEMFRRAYKTDLSDEQWSLIQPLLPPVRSDGWITVEELTVRFLEWAEGYYLKDGKLTKSAARIQTALRHT